MTAAAICGACEEVVYPDLVVLADHHLGYTWLGSRARWTSAHFGIVHECDPARRQLVYARTGELVANPPWIRWLWRYRATRQLASYIAGDRQFCPRMIIKELQ